MVCYETEMPMMTCRQPNKQPRHDRLGVFFYPAYHIEEKINIKACLPHTIVGYSFDVFQINAVVHVSMSCGDFT